MFHARAPAGKNAETISSGPSRRDLLFFCLACTGLLMWPAAPSDEAIAQRARGWDRAHPSSPSPRQKPDAGVDSGSSGLDIDARSIDSELSGGFERLPPVHAEIGQSSDSNAPQQRKRRQDSRCREVEEPDYRWEGPDAGKRPFCTDASGGSTANVR
jgi:hypothetical protein